MHLALYKQKQLELYFSVYYLIGLPEDKSRYLELQAKKMLFHDCVTIIETKKGQKWEALVYVALQSINSNKNICIGSKKVTKHNIVSSNDVTWHYLICICDIYILHKLFNFLDL